MRTLVFTKNGEISSFVDDFVKRKPSDIVWINLHPQEDKVVDTIIREFGQDEDFQEDLLEEQRPRLTNFKNFSVIVFSTPSRFGQIQVSFIISNKEIISVSEIKPELVERMAHKLQKRKGRMSPTSVLSFVMEEMVEQCIKLLDEQHWKADKMEMGVFKGRSPDLPELQQFWSDSFQGIKVLKADLEVVKEIISDKARFIDPDDYNAYIEDRLLYAIDETELLKESFITMFNIHQANLSHKISDSMHKLTLIGSILLIPTIIASLFGMNIGMDGVPPWGFWEITVGSAALSVVTVMLFKKLKWI